MGDLDPARTLSDFLTLAGVFSTAVFGLGWLAGAAWQRWRQGRRDG